MQLNMLQMVQFGCPKHRNPCISSTFEYLARVALKGVARKRRADPQSWALCKQNTECRGRDATPSPSPLAPKEKIEL